MEEELSEHELEERMYSTLHYVDDTQANRTDCSDAREDVQIVIIPRSNVRRYWRTSGDQNSQYRKVNPPQNTTLNNTEKLQQKPKPLEANQLKSNPQNSNQSTSKQVNQPAKEETSNSSNEASDLSIFQQPVSNNLKKTIEILDIDDDCRVVDIQSSDEDEVIEVLLPPKPTITIESSDDEVCPVVIESPSKENNFKNTTESKVLREVSSSPVPSVVSSVSDEFIRGDCIALNISSRHNNNQSFDFSLHGTDLLGQTPSKKKKKKNKNTATSTPISNQVVITNNNSGDTCFATPKSKAKKKKKKSKAQKNILNNDYYDSDSNLSLINSNKRSYTVTEKSLPSADVYESDSNQSEQNNVQKMQHQEIMGTQIESSDSSVTDKPEEVNTIPSTNNADDIMIVNDSALVDLTAPEPEINENIIMANVTGFPEDDSDNNDYTVVDNATKLGSTKIPAILCEDLDFDNLKGKEQVFKRRRYSLTTLRAEMEKFYNESWGGENFNHREIQKNMSRDKSLWVIDPKDKMPSMTKRKATCNYCNRIGHRDDACKWKPPVCFMCGSEGHYEPRCPKKICVNCGSPNHIYSNICRNCCNWHNMNCNECGQNGHPASHCPDVWRRYHNTIDVTLKLEQNLQTKKYYQHFCSGCTRRGHLVHACRNTLPFSGLPINSPYVFSYNPIYTNMSNENTNPNKNRIIQPDTTVTSLSPSTRMDRNKRQSKSPVVHETHINKKRHMSESGDAGRNTKSPLNANKNVPLSQVDTTKCTDTNKSSITKEMVEGDKNAIIEAAPDYIPLNKSPNHNEKGQMIQDNEVSDTSEVITSARIYLTKEIKEALNTDEGRNWLNDAKDRNKITFTVDENSGNSLFLSIIGSVGNQEAFQSELREWAKSKNLNQSDMDANKNKSLQQQLCDQMPRKRITLLRKVTEALESLNRNIGDPNALFKELKYLQNRHGQLLKTKVVSTQQLDNNRDNMKRMMRKLNMILLGQAGLAGGMEHLNELCELQRRLTNLRQNTVTKSLRDEIGCHYHYIFSGSPREDYADLVNKYYIGRNNTLTYKKRNDKVFKISPKPQKKTVNVVQRSNDILDVECTDKTEPKTRKLQKTINKLVFYHRRLVNSLPADSTSKKTRHFLMQKLHGNITRLGTLTKISTTAVKKLQRIQDMAQMFLSNV